MELRHAATLWKLRVAGLIEAGTLLSDGAIVVDRGNAG